MADDKPAAKRRTKGKKFATLAARAKYLYGKEAKTHTLNGNRNF